MQVKGKYFLEQVSESEAEHLKKQFSRKKKTPISRGGDVDLTKFILGYSPSSEVFEVFQRNGDKQRHRIITESSLEADLIQKVLIDLLNECRESHADQDYVKNYIF
ncbi:MAG: hypothetical protein PVJ67_01230 [Candidatus Pacearchaeota archaeon]|jgi:hypothetical protein